MSALVAVLLGLGLLVLAAGLLGVLRARSAADAVHHLSAAGTWGPLLVGLALVLDAGPFSEGGAKTALVVLLLVLQSPFTAHGLTRLVYLVEGPVEQAEEER